MSRGDAIEDQAARWLIRREEPGWSSEDETALDAWLDSSFANKAAYWRLEHGWRAADRIGSLGRSSVVPRRWRPPARSVGIGLLAASLIVTLSLSMTRTAPDPPSPTPTLRYATRIGAHREVPLTDGSRIDLNTATAVRARLDAGRREIWLDRGEAYFEVAHRGGQPFVVHAGNRTITVLGTKFSVRRDGEQVTVAVVEGRVRVDDTLRPADVPAAIITAGNVAIGRGPATLLAVRPEETLKAGLAWRSGLLRFDDVSLADAAAQFNRYNERQIVVVDGAAKIRIGGTFEAGNADAFVRLLHDAYGLRIETDEHGTKISD